MIKDISLVRRELIQTAGNGSGCRLGQERTRGSGRRIRPLPGTKVQLARFVQMTERFMNKKGIAGALRQDRRGKGRIRAAKQSFDELLRLDVIEG